MKHQPRHTVTPTIAMESGINPFVDEFEFTKIDGVLWQHSDNRSIFLSDFL